VAVGDGSCQCNTGYRIVIEACKACEVGSFKNIFGNTSLATEECEVVEKFLPREDSQILAAASAGKIARC
jgi:hypothetical protein